MRFFLLGAALVALPACTSGTGDTVEGQPTVSNEDGLSLSVTSVRPEGDKTVVELVAVNGGSRPEPLGREYSPITLVDGAGTELEGPKETIEVPAYSSDRLRVEFAGRASGERMALQARDLTLADLPTSATTFEAGPLPTAGDLSGAQVNHANGSTARVMGVTFGDTETSVEVEVVNGHDGEIRLSGSSSDPLHLLDQTGRVYPLVPPPANADLSVQEGQTLRGTLRFAGRVPATVQRLTLNVNTRYGGDQDFATRPKISIPIPLVPR